MKIIVLASILVFSGTAAAVAGSPPLPSHKGKERVEASCAALGPDRERFGHGCINTETGAAVTCSGAGCTEYGPDPRYKAVKALLDANRRAPQKQAL